MSVGLTAGGWGAEAAAQQIEGGATLNLAMGFFRGVDTAADPSGNYLAVGGQGALVAVCINSAGSPIGGPYTINATAGGYASFPKVTYSPHANGGAGGFMVFWAEAPDNPDAMRQLFARVVSCTGGLSGTHKVIAPEVWWEPGNLGVAYSPVSQQFFVAWRTPTHSIRGSLVDNTGAPVGQAVTMSSGLGRDPGVTWNSVTNDFGVSFSGETYSAFVVVPPSNPAGFNRNTFNISSAILTTMTDVAYNAATGRYMMGWFELGGGAFAKVAEFDVSANLITSGIASSRLGSYDAFSMAYNVPSGTFGMVGVNRANDTVMALELNSRGFPFNGENTVSVMSPSRHPRISGSATSKTFNVAFSGANFGSLASLIATSFAASGGPAGSFDAPPPPPPTSDPIGPAPSPTGCTTIQPGPGWTCVNGNWLPPADPTTTPTSPTTCPTASPGAGWTCVNGNWVAPTTSSTPSTSGCTTIQPGAGWTCVNGNWLPPSDSTTTTTSTTTCPTASPGAGWTCVNGNWVAPTTSSSSSSTGCTTIQPGPDWICANGNWLPPGTVTSTEPYPAPPSPTPTTTSCAGTAPASGWVCVQGNWVPPDHPLALGGGD